MEQFKAIMHEYPSEVNIKIVTHAVECVKGLLKEDLAAFEKEWITECVLSKPMELLVLISQKKHEDAWNKVIEKSFEMLGEMVETWSGHLDTYSEALVKTSIQTFTPHVRKRGFKCVISLVKSSLQAEVSTPLLLRILSDPDETLSARVPVAELIGVVCERRPETVGNIYKDIWRTYLCVLENSKLSDSLIGGVLTGMNGLFKEFGEELPIVELNNLYDSVTSSYIHKKSCRMACVDLLANHCRLFRERVLRDADVKPALWNILCAEKNTTECVMAALDHIYDMVFQHGTPASAHMEDLHKHEVNHFILPSPKQTQKPSSYLVMFRYQFVGLPVSRRLLHRFLVEEIFTADLYPKTRSQITQMKNMANRIISKTIGKYRNLISEEIIDKFNRDVVEMSSKVLFEAHQKMLTLRMAESFQYDHSFVQCMDQACWLAPLNHSNSENLFRLLVLGYRLTPKRKDVVHCLLTSHEHRAVAVSFLISETCVLNLDGSKTQNFEQYQLLWRDLFDSRNGTDALVLENAQFVFDDFVNCLTLFMESLLENDCNISSEESRARLSVMLELAACVMEMENVREWRREHVPYLLDAALRLQDACGVTVGMLRVMPILLADLTVEREGPLHVRCVEVCSSLDVSRCSDEPLLCLTCLALANVPQHFVQDIKIILEAFKLLFSRKDVEAKVLVTSLEKFGKLLQNGSVKNYEPIVIEIIIMLKNLHYNINVSDHHGRLLRRNILLFIGKYGTLLDERSIPKVIVLRHIKDSLFLQLPNYIDGSSFKLNLHRILHLAIEGEDAESLHSLLLIICANAEIVGKLHQIEEVVVCVIHKLCRCYSRGEVAGNVQDLEQAMLLFSCGGCVRALLECIINEISPGVRKMLSDILTSVLQHDPLSDATEEAVRIMVERCCLMLESVQATSKRAGLDLTMTVLEALTNSNALTTRYLPDLLVLTLRTQENDFQTTFDALTDYFKQKSDLFDVQAMDKITDELFKSISEAKYISSVYLKIIEKCLNVVKYINISKDNNEAIFELYTKHFTLICDDKIYFAQAICVLSKMSSILDFNMELKRSISHFGDYAILNEAIKWAQSFYNKRFDMETYFLFESFMDLLIEYSHVFLEFKYQNTLELLSILISTLPVLYLKRLNKKIGMCMQCFAESWGCAPPHSFTNSVHMWLKSQQIDAITDHLNNCIVVGDSAAVVHGIKLMLKIMRLNKNQSIFCDDIYEKIKSWVIIIQKLHNRHFQVKDKFKMAALSDSVEISLYFMTDNEILKLIIDSQAAVSNNLTFYQKYIAAFTHCLLNNQVLSDGRLSSHLPRLLYEILCYFGTKTCSKKECDVVLDLVDKLFESHRSEIDWDELTGVTTDLPHAEYSDKGPFLGRSSRTDNNWSVIEGSCSVSTLCITTAISKLPHKDRLSLTSRPATWLLTQVARDDLTLSQRIVFMETLSGFLFNQENTQLLSSAVQGHSAALPTRLSELTCRSDPRAFTVILDALAVCGNRSLLDTVCWMVSAEESSGWWDEAIDECMASLSTRNDTQVAVAIYDNYDSCHIFTIKPISQMLVPLLRHSTSRYNEEFFSKTITKILDCLNRTYKEKTNESLYRRLMTKQTASFMLLQVMFQKQKRRRKDRRIIRQKTER